MAMDLFKTDSRRWMAVRERCPAADGVFWYAVKTTGVFCRPTCRSRMPRRENVLFFDTPAAAEWEGFRACKRCRPHETAAAQPHRDAMLQACRRIEKATSPPSLRELADQAGLSPHHFQRVFKRIIGVSPKQYAMANRAIRFGCELRRAHSVTEAIHGAGYASHSRAYEGAAARVGMKPSLLQKGGRGARVQYGIAQTSLGLVLIAATQTGVCAIEFGDDGDALARRVAELFPHADRHEGGRTIGRFIARVVRFLARPRIGLDLPLDVQGTAFQHRVWQALRGIPPGETRSYKELAASIGKPTAIRAVAQACASNRVSLAVPCHRVISSDGGLGGYRWGAERKASLLDRES